jgi:hypothetical protein
MKITGSTDARSHESVSAERAIACLVFNSMAAQRSTSGFDDAQHRMF